MHSSTLDIQVLGGIQCAVDGRPLKLAAPAERVLVRLAVARRRRLARLRLAADLWPEAPEDRVRRRLSEALSRLRRQSGHRDLVTGDLVLVLGPPPWRVRSTLDDLRGRAARGDHDAVLDSAHAVLPGIEGAWVDEIRDEVRELVRVALEARLDHSLRIQDWARARADATRLLHHSPWSERGHAGLLNALSSAGRRAEAMAHYRQYCQRLRSELGMEPERELQLLARAIRRVEVSPPTGPAPLPLVGRELVLERGVRALDDLARPATGALVHLVAPAGMGKTRVLDEIERMARLRGVAVARVASPSGRPLGVLEAVLEQHGALALAAAREQVGPLWWRVAAAALPSLALGPAPELPTLDDADAAQRLEEALRQILVALAGHRPWVALVDDAHRGDPGSLEALARAAGEAPALVVLAARPQPGAPTLPAPRYAQRWELPPLTTAEVAHLAEAGLDMRSADAAAKLARAAGGNPFLVVQWLRRLRRDRRALHTATHADLEDVLRVELAPLTPVQRSVLEAAAVLGRAAQVEELRIVAEEPAALDACRGLVAAGWLADGRGGLSVVHDLVGAHVHEALEDSRRRTLHRRALQLERTTQGRRPDALTRHAAALGDHAGVAVDALDAARQAREVHDLASAGRFLTLARDAARDSGDVDRERQALLEHADVARLQSQQRLRAELHEALRPLVADDAGLVARLKVLEARLAVDEGRLDELPELGDAPSERRLRAECAYHGGRFEEARALLQGLEEVLPADEVGDALTLRASTLCRMGRFTEAGEAIDAVLAHARATAAPMLEVRALIIRSAVCNDRGDAEGSALAAGAARRLALDIGYLYGQASALNNLAYAYALQGRLDRALGSFEETLTLATRMRDRTSAFHSSLNCAVITMQLGQPERALVRLEEARALLPEDQNLGGLPVYRINRAAALRAMGRLEEARDEAARAGAEAETAAVPLAVANASLLVAQCCLEGGELEPAAAALAVARRVDEAHDLGSVAAARAALEAELCSASGDPEGALARLESVGHGDLAVDMAAARALRAVGRAEEASALLRSTRVRLVQAARAIDDPELQERFLYGVPDHKVAVGLFLRTVGPLPEDLPMPPDAVRVDLRDGGGRPVAVVWTPRSPPADAHVRRASIARLREEAAAQGGVPSSRDLAAALGVTARTVRRDLARLT